MSQSRLLSLVGKGAALCILGLVLACGKKNESSDTTRVDSAAVVSVDTTVDTYGRRPAVPALDTNPALAAGLPTMGWNRRRLGRDCGGCTVTVWMGAYKNNVPPDTRNPPRERKVALVINTSLRHRADMYGFQPFAAYDLIYKTVGGKAEFEFDPLWAVDGELAKGPVLECPRKDHRHTEQIADFRGCNDPIAVAPKTASMLGPALTKLLRFFDSAANEQRRGEDPAWWSCGSGCCTAKAVYPT